MNRWLVAGAVAVITTVLFFLILGMGRRPTFAPVRTSHLQSTLSQETKPTFQFPTLESIFSSNHHWTATLSGNLHVRSLIATGDIIPARMVNVKVLDKNDFTYPYKKTADVVKDADITFGNLEAPLIDACKPTREGMTFCSSSKNIDGLTFAGVDVVNLANNHAGNYQAAGLEQTIRHLTAANIAYTGSGDVAVVTVNGKRFGFVGFSDIPGTCCGLRLATEDIIKEDIAKARSKADIVVAQFHWGTEYKEDPDLRVRELGKMAVDAGADLVIGNHPHWVQGVEFYKGKLITYAHGNYVFDQMWSVETRQGVLGKYTFYDNQLVDAEYYPIVIDDYAQARPANKSESSIILARMLRSSQKLEKIP